MLEKLALGGLRLLKPESAHKVTLKALEVRALLPGSNHSPLAGKPQQLMGGLNFLNQVGIAAGLDKDGLCINGMVSLGVGFIELGGVTPQPQTGNIGNRIIRLAQQQAMVNRLGFNNLGSEHLAHRIRNFRENYYAQHKRHCSTIIGVNIGKNTTTSLEYATEDYCKVLQTIHSVADYATINISSPNTLGLRELQKQNYLAPLLQKLAELESKLQQTNGKSCPLLVKLSPDLGDEQLRQTVNIINQAGIAGVIATNTSSQHPWQQQMEGGLSGRPLAARAGEVLAKVNSELADNICLIACGGIDSKQEMANRIARGADLVQLYTALVYKGSGLIRDLMSNNQ